MIFQENEDGALDWAERREQESRAYEKDIRKLREEIEQNRAALEELQLEVTLFLCSLFLEREIIIYARKIV